MGAMREASRAKGWDAAIASTERLCLLSLRQGHVWGSVPSITCTQDPCIPARGQRREGAQGPCLDGRC